MSDVLCVHCNRTEEQHCVFEAPIIPAGCVCEIGDWGNPSDIPAICSQYVRMGGEYDDPVCKTCEHEESCHGATTTEASS